ELRSTGCQTIAPGSVHEDTGEPIRFDADGEPLPIDPDDLLEACSRLNDHTLRELGVQPSKTRTTTSRTRHVAGSTTAYGRKALTDEAGALRGTREGARNHTLNRAAFRM